MVKIRMTFPGGKKKAFTLSYDDGVTQDKRLIQIFNKNNLKATFNLNSGLQGEHGYFVINNLKINRLNKEEIRGLYTGHEIAIHGLTHLSLTDISKEMIYKEVLEDKKNHESIFNYPIEGMAYPNGVYNDTVIEELNNCGIEYSRTVNSHGEFILPVNYLRWNPTAHHNDDKLMELAKSFVEMKNDEIKLFYLWGHSYEFDLDNNWEVIEEFSNYISNRNDIWYATNIEIIKYMKALKNIIISDQDNYIHNTSKISIWVELNDELVEVRAGEIKKYHKINSNFE